MISADGDSSESLSDSESTDSEMGIPKVPAVDRRLGEVLMATSCAVE
jgi:hypothetical protein